MGSLILISLIIVVIFAVLCYLFNDSRVIELDSLTIAAVEARAEALSTRQAPAVSPLPRPPAREKTTPVADSEAVVETGAEMPRAYPPSAPGYEYRELLEENGENYVLPQWMVNFFSSSDVCHTLDPADNVLFVVKLNDRKNAEGNTPEITADCDMSTQTIALKFAFGEGATAEALRTKFYLFERGDLFELNRLVRQNDARIDVLTRAPDYTLEYTGTMRVRVPQSVLAQLKSILARVPS